MKKLKIKCPECGWVAVTDVLPKPLQTVWLTNGKGWVSLGCLIESDGGWHWAEGNGVIYIENGEIVWSHGVDGKAIFSTPAILDDSNLLVVAPVSHPVVALDLLTGERIWSIDVPKSPPVFSSLLAVGNHVVFGTHGNNLVALECSRTGATIKWVIDTDSPVFATPYALCFSNNHIRVMAISINGTLYTIDLAAGEVLLSTQLPGPLFSSPVPLSPSALLQASRDNNVYCFSTTE